MVAMDLPRPANIWGSERGPAKSGVAQAVRDPATGEEIGQVPLSGPADVDAAVAVARRAAVDRASVPVLERARRMFRLHHLVERDQDYLATLVTRENGKARSDALGEVIRGLEVIEFAAGMPTLILDEAITVANRSEFGNSSSIFTNSGRSARVFRETIEAGMLGINLGVPAPVGLFPFSGWKGSFFGDLHANGLDGVRFYTRIKAITARWPGR